MKKFNRLLSIAVALLMAVTSAPLEVLANLQAPVLEGGITISDSSPTTRGSSTYTLNVNWQTPPMSPNPDNQAVGDFRTTLHPIVGYDLYRRNASTSEQYIAPEAPVTLPTPDTTSENRQFSNLQLKSGSLYLFRVVPYHTHVFPLTDTTTETRRANPDTGYKEGEAIYLTDISITGIGRGNQMTVTWDNPTIDGMDVFTSYKISYVLKGSMEIPEITDTYSVTVATSDATSVEDGKLEYTFLDPRLEPGDYSIKVEPMYNGQLFRRLQQINYNGKIYSVSSTSREYRTDDAYVMRALYAEPNGSDYLRLYWDKIIAQQDIQKIEIYASDTEDFSRPYLIGTLLGDSARNITSFLTDMPDYLTYYRLSIYTSDAPNDAKYSEIRPYDPTYSDFRPYNPKILDISDNGESPYTLKMLWDPFIREPYNDEERQDLDDNGRYIDKDITYDIWVTDDPSNFNDSSFRTRVSASVDATGLLMEEVWVDPDNEALGKKPAYAYSLTGYYERDLEGTYSEKPFTENKIYYVRIVARRNTIEGQTSQEATGQHFLPPKDPVAPIPNMTSRPPLRIMTDENGKMITQNSITVQWDLRWFEVYDESAKTWYPLGWNGSEIVTGYNLESVIPYGQETLDALGNAPSTADKQAAIDYIVNEAGLTAPVRLMDLSGSDYEIHVARDDYVLQNGGYEGYLATINSRENSNDWQDVTPTGGEMHPYFTVTNENKPTTGNLQSNTAYVIFFRAFTEIDGTFYAWYPNYVTATTMEARGPVDVVPTVPLLEPVDQSDTYLVVRWEYSDVLKYELRYSDLLSDYSAGGTAISWEQIQEDGEFSTEGDKRYITYTIRNLFPETSYNIWIRSIAPNSTGDLPSDWSNPIYMTTTEVVKPDPPKGLGLASKDSIGAYNKENSTKYAPIDIDYMVVEWQRNYADTVADTTGGAAGGGDAKFLSSPSLLSSYMALFENLKANLTYYVRAKTILVVTKQNDGVAKNFYYVVEVADNPDFLDAKRIQVPGNTVTGDPVYTITKESDWSATVYFVTSPSTGEYDSDKNDNMYPLPTQDYEIIYDAETETLTYRFRTNSKDASGANDNGVDQRFITKLVKNRTYTYDLDLSKYDGKVITRRTVELPYSIYKAFEERKINFKLTADNITVTIPPGAMNTKEVTGIKDFGVNAKVNVTLTKNAAGTPTLATGEVYSSAPQKLSVQVVSPTRTVQLPLLAKPLNIDLKLDHRYDTLDKNVGSYMADVNTVGWERANSQYNNLAGVMTLATDKVMNYSVVAKNLPFVAVQDDSIDAFYNVTSRLNITDMGSYDPSANVTATQFNNIVAAIAKGRLSVAIDTDLPAGELQSLTKSKLAVSGGTVSREAGIASLVRLYELKTKSAVKGYPSINETGYSDIAAAQQAYQIPLLKAEYLGLYGERPQVAPKAALTLGEMLKIIDIIISDAGL